MPRTSATVPLDTPGTSSTDPIAKPRSTWATVPRTRSAGIAPAHPGAQLGQVVVGAVHGDGQQRGAGGHERLPLLGRVTVRADGALDLGGVATDVGAVLREDLVLALERLDVGPAVPDVGVLGDVPQRLALPAAADEHRDVPGGGRVELAPPLLDPGQRLGQG